ncbi:EAL domain-containing protein [Alteromonas gilva]|uniref:EAL domain-containing protein n=1 Tax=Alteromonas gilva TaxID=2987522 RepID=A0ABT5L4E1_9ALTE|nr:EAL domain-containing protein [Alteromonas gilva]MDC8831918.1 EAL domain-containing protein [Alteromonas gilva]
MKRLLITSVIVFWIAIWLALTLSSFILKRAEEINNTLADLDTSKGHRAIVSAALTLADSFDCDINAEGVEKTHHAEFIISMGCFIGLGYYFAKPMPEDQIKTMIKAGSVLP